MAGSAGKGRPKGARNRRTLEAYALAGEGETPVEFGLRLMRDESFPPDLRIHGARIAAPYLHSKPLPESRFVSFEFPVEIGTCTDLLAVHASLIKATAEGEVALEEAREVSALLETHRRLVETVELEQRITRLEQEKRT